MVLGYVRNQVQAISRYDPLVRRDEPDAVHQMRVATRRARSALQAFGTIIEREATRPLCEELKWLAAQLRQARDGEVLLARLTAELDAITGHFTAELAQAGQATLRALDGQRYLRLLNHLDVLLADPPLTPLAGRKAGKALTKPVRRAARRLERALAAVPAAHDPAADDPAADDRDAALHEARKAAKRARYAAETALPALGGAARRQAAQAKKLQELLGDHHDSVVAVSPARSGRPGPGCGGGHVRLRRAARTRGLPDRPDRADPAAVRHPPKTWPSPRPASRSAGSRSFIGRERRWTGTGGETDPPSPRRSSLPSAS